MFKHVLLPTDGSKIARKAIKAGIALAKELGAKVTAYYAIDAMPAYSYSEGYLLRRRRAQGVRQAGPRAGREVSRRSGEGGEGGRRSVPDADDEARDARTRGSSPPRKSSAAT